MRFSNVASFGEVSSTNDQVKKMLAAGAQEGYVCRARSQSGGYGRQGRLWTSPEGGLYQSVLLRPACERASLPTLGFVMALSIRAALLSLAALPSEAVQVKWPNDLMADDRKIAGISLEASGQGVCIGVGVNVFHPASRDDLLFDGKYEPTFLEDLGFGSAGSSAISFGSGHEFATRQDAVGAVGDAVLSAFAQCYPVWLENGFSPFRDEYRSCSYLEGKRVRMQLLNGSTIVEGTVVGVDDAGQLLVDDGSKVHLVNSGEAHVL